MKYWLILEGIVFAAFAGVIFVTAARGGPTEPREVSVTGFEDGQYASAVSIDEGNVLLTIGNSLRLKLAVTDREAETRKPGSTLLCEAKDLLLGNYIPAYASQDSHYGSFPRISICDDHYVAIQEGTMLLGTTDARQSATAISLSYLIPELLPTSIQSVWIGDNDVSMLVRRGKGRFGICTSIISFSIDDWKNPKPLFSNDLEVRKFADERYPVEVLLNGCTYRDDYILLAIELGSPRERHLSEISKVKLIQCNRQSGARTDFAEWGIEDEHIALIFVEFGGTSLQVVGNALVATCGPLILRSNGSTNEMVRMTEKVVDSRCFVDAAMGEVYCTNQLESYGGAISFYVWELGDLFGE